MFVLNGAPEGNCGKGRREKKLAMGTYLVIHALAADLERQRKGIASETVRYCIDRA